MSRQAPPCCNLCPQCSADSDEMHLTFSGVTGPCEGYDDVPCSDWNSTFSVYRDLIVPNGGGFLCYWWALDPPVNNQGDASLTVSADGNDVLVYVVTPDAQFQKRVVGVSDIDLNNIGDIPLLTATVQNCSCDWSDATCTVSGSQP